MIENPNILAGHLIKGKHEKVAGPYQHFTTTAVGAPYKDPTVAGLRKYEKSSYLKGGHDKDFVMAKKLTHQKSTHASSYVNLPDGKPGRNPKSYRTKDGDVIIAPVNFLTMPAKKGNVPRRDNIEFGGVIPYKESDYTIMKKLVSAEVKKHYDIVATMQDGKAFYNGAHDPKHNHGYFSKPQDTLGCDVELPELNSF